MNFSYLNLHYVRASVVQTAQINYVLLTVMKFWLEKRSRKLKVVVYLSGGLFANLTCTVTSAWLIGDKTLLRPREGQWCNVVTYNPLIAHACTASTDSNYQHYWHSLVSHCGKSCDSKLQMLLRYMYQSAQIRDVPPKFVYFLLIHLWIQCQLISL